MDNIVDSETLCNFKRRYRMRLHLLKAPLGSTDEEVKAIEQGLEKLTKTVIKKTELGIILNILEQGIMPINVNIDEQIQALENMDTVTWKELSEFQERFFSFSILAYQQSLDFQHNLNSALQQIIKIAVKKPKNSQKKTAPSKIPVTVVEPIQQYSTPAIQAMDIAIKEFWLDFDGKKPPTQKQVSNFIAEKIGEPIRNRFTDELARAIKPANV